MAAGQTRPLLIVSALCIAAVLFASALMRVRIDMDIASSLPTGDPVVADAVHLFRHHPLKDQLAIDIGLSVSDPDLLVEIAQAVESRLADSGLFESVGQKDIQHLLPQLVSRVTTHLPELFSADELSRDVAPRLSPDAIQETLAALMMRLNRMDSLGQARWMAADPLDLRTLVLSRLAALTRMGNGRLYNGRIQSADGRHALVLAVPKRSGTDTGVARQLAALMDEVTVAINRGFSSRTRSVTLTPVGSYRAALDNESMVRGDVGRAVVWATVGIALLLLAAFPRPLLGLLALLPALAGTAVGFWLYSWIYDNISIMVLGFGGAVISITVDHAIAYLLFLDRPYTTHGRDVAREIRSIGLLAAATTIGAFGLLTVSGFPVFQQLGLFTALGIAGAFFFVHAVFPKAFETLPPAAGRRRLPLGPVVEWMCSLGRRGAWGAAILAAALLLWARPGFDTDLSRMNSVRPETRKAEALMAEVWGDIFSNTYLLVEAPSFGELQHRTDRLQSALDGLSESGSTDGALTLAPFFPGLERRQSQREAWRRFWSPERVRAVRQSMVQAGERLGFTTDAFAPFFEMLNPDWSTTQPTGIPETGLLRLLGVTHNAGDGVWRQVAWFQRPASMSGETLYQRFSPVAKVFDPALFGDRFGRLLFDTFIRLLGFISLSVAAMLLVFFVDWRLTMVSLLPLAFALCATLGALGLMGRMLDIPALMLAIVILGMGVDYSLFMVCAYQRYQQWDHPMFRLTRMAVFMASASTLIGFGALCTAQHRLLQSAGLSSLLGIGFCLAGSYTILPPILRRRFEPKRGRSGAKTAMTTRYRYRNLEAYPRLFAWFKLRLDPMFAEMGALIPEQHAVVRIIDLGCGFGVPASWLLERFPDAAVCGLEPRADRVRVAGLALGAQGCIHQGAAPDIEAVQGPADLALMLDMNHFLDDRQLCLTLSRLNRRMAPGGLLVVRSVLPPRPGIRWFERVAGMMKDGAPAETHHRQPEKVEALHRQCGFAPMATRYSGKRQDLFWLVARATPDAVARQGGMP